MTGLFVAGSAHFAAVLVGEDASRAEAAVVAAGGRVAGRFGWVGGLDIAGGAVLVVEAEGQDARALADALPAIARAAAERGCRVVASFDRHPDVIDAVAAVLLGRAELLVEPDESEFVAALVRAASGAKPEPTLREEPDWTDGPGLYHPPPTGVPPTDAGELRRVIRARRLRDRVFGAGLFEDPAWDILLDLFAASLEGSEVSVSSLCIAAGVAPTTALRWIARMTTHGLLLRQHDPLDRRRALMSLSASALAGMRSYAGILRAQGLPFV